VGGGEVFEFAALLAADPAGLKLLIRRCESEKVLGMVISHAIVIKQKINAQINSKKRPKSDAATKNCSIHVSNNKIFISFRATVCCIYNL